MAFLLMPLNESCSLEVKVDVIPTEFGLKIKFQNYTSDFDISYSDGFLNLKFKEGVEFSGLGKLSNYKSLIRSYITKNDILQLLFVDQNVRVQKFSESNSSGVYIFLTKESLEKLSNSDSKKNDDKTLKNQEQKPDKSNKTDPKKDVDETKATSLEIQVDGNASEKVRVIFNWNKMVGAASFIRAGKLWIIFDQNISVNIPKFSNFIIKNIKKEDILKDLTTLTIDVDEKSLDSLNKTMYLEGNKWILEISSGAVKPKDIRVLSKPFAAPRPRVEVEMVDKSSEIFTFLDPYIGDQITVVTTRESASANLAKREFVDFTVPETIQGALIERKNDSLIMTKRENIVRIEGAASINIAPQVIEKSEEKVEVSNANFKIDEFKEDYQAILSLKSYILNGDELYEKISEIREKIRNSDDLEQRTSLYANWATLLMANQLYTEASLILGLIRQEDQEFYNSYKIRVMDLALNFMKKDFVSAYRISRALNVHSIPISLRKEARFWQAVSAFAVMGSDDYITRLDPASIYIEGSRSFLDEYSNDLRIEIGLLLAQLQIKNRELQTAKAIINTINNFDLNRYHSNQLLRITANFYVEASNTQKAFEFWDKCIADVSDHYNMNLCRYEKALYMNSISRISKQDLKEELEKIVASWRGDELEINSLQLLGDTYYDLKNYPQAIRTWNEILENYPFSPAALSATRKMSRTFVAFYTEGRDQSVSDLEAAAFFFEFEKIIPVGDLGDEVALKLSEHLIGLDLLDKAAQILHHQIMHRLKGFKRENAINMLAEVYISDKRYTDALDIIDYGDDYNELPDDISSKRRYLQAVAYHHNSEDAKAIELLQGDFSKEADEIKSKIYWNRSNWREFNYHVEPRIYEIRDLQGEISPEDTEKVLKLAISYMMLGQNDLLEALYEDFDGRFPKDGLSSFAIETLNTTWKAIHSDAIESLRDVPEMIDKVNKLIEDIKKPKPM